MAKKTRKQTIGNYTCSECGRKDTKLLAHSIHMSRKHGIKPTKSIHAIDEANDAIKRATQVLKPSSTRVTSEKRNGQSILELLDDLQEIAQELNNGVKARLLEINKLKEKADAFDAMQQMMSLHGGKRRPT
jgi:hypothetical protein